MFKDEYFLDFERIECMELNDIDYQVLGRLVEKHISKIKDVASVGDASPDRLPFYNSILEKIENHRKEYEKGNLLDRPLEETKPVEIPKMPDAIGYDYVVTRPYRIEFWYDCMTTPNFTINQASKV